MHLKTEEPEYESLAGAGVLKDPRVELIDGYLVRKMTKKPRHTTITEWLRDRLAETLPPGWHFRKEEPVRIPSFDEPEPDLTVARGGIKDYSDRHPGPADIALIVEVADTSLDRDRGEKLSAYAKGGVPVYWVVNLVDQWVEVYTDPDTSGRYRTRTDFKSGAQIFCLIGEVQACQVDAADLF